MWCQPCGPAASISNQEAVVSTELDKSPTGTLLGEWQRWNRWNRRRDPSCPAPKHELLPFLHAAQENLNRRQGGKRELNGEKQHWLKAERQEVLEYTEGAARSLVWCKIKASFIPWEVLITTQLQERGHAMSQPNSELVIPAQKPSVASQRAWDETTRPLHWHAGPPLVSPEGWVYSFPSNPQHKLFPLFGSLSFLLCSCWISTQIPLSLPRSILPRRDCKVRGPPPKLCLWQQLQFLRCLRAFMVGYKLWQGLCLLTMGFLALHTVPGHIIEFDKWNNKLKKNKKKKK